MAKPSKGKREPKQTHEQRQHRRDVLDQEDFDRGRAVASRAIELGVGRGGIDLLIDRQVVCVTMFKRGIYFELIEAARLGMEAPFDLAMQGTDASILTDKN